MPYVRCPGCGLETYSAAVYSQRESCPSCHDPLPLASRAPLSLGVAGPLLAAPAKRRTSAQVVNLGDAGRAA